MRKVAILWVVSVGAAAAVSAGMTAQVQSGRNARILSGNDIGFRVDGQRSERRSDALTGQPTMVDVLRGQLVVRVNGRWFEAEFSGGGVRPLTD
jgi:hypothetical protein